ncbi:hypothetical protein [Flavicella sp.]|uniref:hypothetical protein n=1 Tax=Flavicella sp. TaxID=2957742 RepID=UPI003015C11D
MKNKFRISKTVIISCLLSGLLFTSCDDSDIDDDDNEVIEEGRNFTVAISLSSDGETPVYAQTTKDLTTGTIDFEGYGYVIPSTRTARIFPSDDGNNLYNLDYGGGRIYELSIDGGQDFNLLNEKAFQFAMGTAYARWTKTSSTSASIHYADTDDSEGGGLTRVYDEDGNYVRTDVTLRLMSVELEGLVFGNVEQFIIPVSGEDTEYDYISRVDAPVISGDKIYYGMAKSGYDPLNPDERVDATYTNVETIVADYPSLTNPEIISTTVGGAKGATNGYRTPTGYLDEQGDIYQIITVSDNTYDTHILKIKDGDYDDSFDFNLSELLGEGTKSRGWFYAGNGIGYVPYERTDEEDGFWSVARVDLYNGTAVKLNLPTNLWLTQYQNVVVDDDKVYMAITPTGEDGNIYIFDATSTSPDGFTLGATLVNIADATYIGVY